MNLRARIFLLIILFYLINTFCLFVCLFVWVCFYAMNNRYISIYFHVFLLMSFTIKTSVIWWYFGIDPALHLSTYYFTILVEVHVFVFKPSLYSLRWRRLPVMYLVISFIRVFLLFGKILLMCYSAALCLCSVTHNMQYV